MKYCLNKLAVLQSTNRSLVMRGAFEDDSDSHQKHESLTETETVDTNCTQRADRNLLLDRYHIIFVCLYILINLYQFYLLNL